MLGNHGVLACLRRAAKTQTLVDPIKTAIMNDVELSNLLKSARVPEPNPEHWEEFPRQVTWSLRHRPEGVSRPERSPRRPLLAWGLAFATCLVIGFVAGNWRGAGPAKGLLQNARLVREVVAMFPNQVQAIIQDENGLHLSLAVTANVPQSQPLWIKICDGNHCRSIVTFSGQVVQIDGQRVEALADASGGVILVGEHFFWSSEGGSQPDRVRINAEQMNQVL
jgi:hypothetical protein